MKEDDTVQQMGAKIVAEWLSKKGYIANINARLPDAIGIEAIGEFSKLLILVRSILNSDQPITPSYEEILIVKSNAVERGYVPFQASVQLDENLNLVGRIQFKRL